MLRRMPASVMREWRAYNVLEPFGEERADLRMGILASVAANPYRKKGARPFKPRDFMPEFGKKELRGVELEQHLLDKVVLLNQLFGGRDLRNNKAKNMAEPDGAESNHQ